jgi:hypothetical protein
MATLWNSQPKHFFERNTHTNQPTGARHYCFFAKRSCPRRPVAPGRPHTARCTERGRRSRSAAAAQPRRAAVAKLPTSRHHLQGREGGGVRVRSSRLSGCSSTPVPCATAKRQGLGQRRRCVDTCMSKKTQVESFTESTNRMSKTQASIEDIEAELGDQLPPLPSPRLSRLPRGGDCSRLRFFPHLLRY